MWKNFVWGDGTREVKKVEINGKIAFQRNSEVLIPFTSNPAPTSWSGSFAHYTASNTYGEWQIDSENNGPSGYRVNNVFDASDSSYYKPTTEDYAMITLPTNILIKPTNISIISQYTKNTSVVEGYNPATSSWENLGTMPSSSSKKTTNISYSGDVYFSKFRMTATMYQIGTYTRIYNLQITSGTLKIIT